VPQLQIVTGAGPVGWTIAEQLAAQGHPVRVLTRSGSGPEHPLVERRPVDVSQRHLLEVEFDGAAAVFHCIHGSAYSARAWAAELPAAEQAVLAAAGAAGAVVVFPESLYSYDRPQPAMAEDSPRAAAGGKRGIRTQLLRARAASDTATVSVAASDFFGPRVRNAHAGERMVPAVLAGKTVRVMGRADLPHSFTYVPDLAAAMIQAAQRPEVWDSVLHAPTGAALSQEGLVRAFAAAAGVSAPKVGSVPGWLIRGLGIVLPDLRELAETLYQFEEPFVLESGHTQSALGLTPTPLADAAAQTVRWWRSELREPAAA
jgi:nucleoside-diphosphate-sugar epimerase